MAGPLPEFRLVQGHEAQVEARKEAGEGEEDDDEDPHEPNRQQQGVHLQLHKWGNLEGRHKK
jgi:hypothetical protein